MNTKTLLNVGMPALSATRYWGVCGNAMRRTLSAHHDAEQDGVGQRFGLAGRREQVRAGEPRRRRSVHGRDDRDRPSLRPGWGPLPAGCQESSQLPGPRVHHAALVLQAGSKLRELTALHRQPERRSHRTVVLQGREERDEERAQPFRRTALGIVQVRPDRSRTLTPALRYRGEVQLGLVLEVVVYRASRQPRPLRDPGQRRGGIAALGEHLECRPQQGESRLCRDFDSASHGDQYAIHTLVHVNDTLIHDVRVFTGEALLIKATVVVKERLIASVSPDRPVGEFRETIDGHGRTLMPGLIDAHAHVFAGNLPQALRFGVTTVLDLMADPRSIAELRQQADRASDLADVRTAGTGATVPRGYGWYLVEMGYLPPFPTVSHPDGAEEFVAARVDEGSDYLKILIDDGSTTGMPLPKLGEESIHALVDAARSRKLLTVAHALNASDALLAVSAGVDVLGHAFVDKLPDRDFPYLLAESGTAIIPTLAVLDGLFGRPHGKELLADQRIEPYLDESSRRMLGFGAIPLGPGAAYDNTVPALTVGLLRDAGVPILAGSDASNPDTAHGATLHLELELLVRAGLTPIEALAAATSVPADVFGLADRGRIAPGLRADLLLLEGDPTSEITATRDIVAIWRGGDRLDRVPNERR